MHEATEAYRANQNTSVVSSSLLLLGYYDNNGKLIYAGRRGCPESCRSGSSH